MLTKKQKEALKEAIREWADNHPFPESKFIGGLGKSVLSPKQIADYVEKEEGPGQILLKMWEAAIENGSTTLNKAINSFKKAHDS